MDYFINDAEIRLEVVKQELNKNSLTDKEREELIERKSNLICLLSVYREIKTNIQKNKLDAPIMFIK